MLQDSCSLLRQKSNEGFIESKCWSPEKVTSHLLLIACKLQLVTGRTTQTCPGHTLPLCDRSVQQAPDSHTRNAQIGEKDSN